MIMQLNQQDHRWVTRCAAASLVAGALALGSACSGERTTTAAPVVPARATEEPTDPAGRRSVQVTATAYNSVVEQTDSQPKVTAMGDRLKPGMKVIAVSRDLHEMGLTEDTVVTIEGLPGEWRVADKMDSRWRRRIDVYMGQDEAAAKRFGKRKVTIHWRKGAPEPEAKETVVAQ